MVAARIDEATIVRQAAFDPAALILMDGLYRRLLLEPTMTAWQVEADTLSRDADRTDVPTSNQDPSEVHGDDIFTDTRGINFYRENQCRKPMELYLPSRSDLVFLSHKCNVPHVLLLKSTSSTGNRWRLPHGTVPTGLDENVSAKT
jgi:hypothetical protein